MGRSATWVVGALLVLLGACTSTDAPDVAEGVRLLTDDPSATTMPVTVPSSGHVGPVLEVADGPASLIVSVASAADDLVGASVALLPADVEPAMPAAPHQDLPPGLASPDPGASNLDLPVESLSASPTVDADRLAETASRLVAVEPGWLFLPDAPAGQYQLVASEQASGVTITLQLHPVVTPARADLVGAWQARGTGRVLRFDDDGVLAYEGENSEVTAELTWRYADGELRWTLDGQNDAEPQIYRAALTPEGALLLSQRSSQFVVLPIGRVQVFVPVRT